MISAELKSAKDRKALSTHVGYDGFPVLETTTHAKHDGSFKAGQRSTAGTTVIVTPNGNEAISLTDIIITTDKVNAATVTLQITDGVNTIVIAAANVTDAPCNIAVSLSGNWTGWQGAHVDLVTVGTVAASVSLGYFKVPADIALPFAAWDAKR